MLVYGVFQFGHYRLKRSWDRSLIYVDQTIRKPGTIKAKPGRRQRVQMKRVSGLT